MAIKRKGLLITLGVVGVGGAVFLVYREQTKAKTAAAASAATAAAGYGYGAGAASGYGSGYDNGYYGYGAQSVYGYGSSGGFFPGYYGYGTPTPQPTANTTNAQWVQAAINQLSGFGYDSQTLANALGAYVMGQPVSAANESMVQAAIGVEGYPPESGTDGYPPQIKVQGTGGGGTGGGQQGGGGYVIAPGNETLGQIGKAHGDSIAKIYRLNPGLASMAKHDIPKGTQVRIS